MEKGQTMDVLIRVTRKVDGLYYGRCNEVFGFNIVTDTVEDMMAEAPGFAQTFFGEATLLNICYEFSHAPMTLTLIVTDDYGDGFSGRCVESPVLTVWGETIKGVIGQFNGKVADFLEREGIPSECCKIEVIRPTRVINIKIEEGGTMYFARSSTIRGVLACVPLGEKEKIYEEIRTVVRGILESNGELDDYNYQIQIEDL